MIHSRPALPAGHGELVTRPNVDEWPQLARSGAESARGWEFQVAGRPAGELRREARRLLVAEAEAWCLRLGIGVAEADVDPPLIVATGHQPDLYHPGVWAKDFLLQRLAAETGAVGIDVVVDTDTFDSVSVSAPCLRPDVARCRQYLSIGAAGGYFAGTPVPDRDAIDLFCEATGGALATLPAPSVRRHFEQFCASLREASSRASTLAELITAARRYYEGELTDYLELPVSVASKSEPFLRFVADICLDAGRFAALHNEELAHYRARHGVRSAARPFPDLESDDLGTEVPFWLLSDGRRHPLRARETDMGVELLGQDGVVIELSHDPDAAVARLLETGVAIAPRAITLTLFVRTFLADLFIHGIGGSRYDRVTDAIAHRWWGIELPPFVTASLTMYLPLGAHVVTEEELATLDQRLHRIEHNPDESLGDVEFDTAEECARADALAEEKRSLIAAISVEGADRKALGMRIRAVNEQIGELVTPLAEELAETRRRLAAELAAGDILTDRTYPFCFWSPHDVADKIW